MFNTKTKQLAILIDPDKHSNSTLLNTITEANNAKVDIIFIGGSLVSSGLEKSISLIKENSNIPVYIFPGSLLQISDKADGLLLLSLISGRNPEFLIGNHVVAAPILKKSKINIIPTGYMLINGGKTTSVEYMSNTQPIPSNKPDIALATALAGEMMGNKLIYMDAGSGANNPVSKDIISIVKSNINVPLIVGGGINTSEKLYSAFNAGADIAVVGNAFENGDSTISEFCNITHTFV